MAFPAVVYNIYENHLSKKLDMNDLPEHIGVMVDGNRRWAALAGAPSKDGHLAGAGKIHEFLGWCQDLGIKVVTLYMLSTDNMSRSDQELEDLLAIIGDTLDTIAEKPDIKVHPVGALELLPENLAHRLTDLGKSTADNEGLHVNVAVGYGGRQEIVDAVRELLVESQAEGQSVENLAQNLQVDDISRFLYTRGQPDPELVIRTSGEQRISGFLMWQSAYSEFYFCEALWPDFRRVDFLRALRDFSNRHRRFGS